MLGISVELGTYSIKFINYRIEKKSVQLLNTDEIVIDRAKDEEEDGHNFQLLWHEQLQLVQDYLKDIKVEYQLMLNLPNDIVSSRFITLPVKNKKRASMMLPFQIEEDLPYSLSDCHWAETFEQTSIQIEATVGIVRKEHFSTFFNEMIGHNVKPQVLTSDFSAYAAFIANNKAQFPSSFCVINIGHHTTRGFYFHQGKLVSTHQSYVAGQNLTESISQTYSITYDEATIYKHQNSFLLLEEQYDDVNENQREFAKVMDATLSSLLSDIKRWDIGFRVKHGEAIKQIFICGGSANIKNIDNYLTAKLGVEVVFFDPYKFVNAQRIDSDEKVRRKFVQVSILAANSLKKSRLQNFLKGDYNIASGSDIPLESMAFVGIRAGMISLFISVFFIIQLMLTNSANKTAKAYAEKLYKHSSLNQIITTPIARRARNSKNYRTIVKRLENKEKLISQEVKVIQSSLKINALASLNHVISLLNGQKVELIKFSRSEDKNVDFTISAQDINILEQIKASLTSDGQTKWFVELNKEKLTLTAGGKSK